MTEKKYPTSPDPRDSASGGFFLNKDNLSRKITHLFSENEMDAVVTRMAEDIVNECGGKNGIVLVGVRSRGVPLAKWLAKKMEEHLGQPISVGSLDINLYRDDLSEVDDYPVIHRSELEFSVIGKGVILVDDVLYTGRTIRAALDALMDFGRPRFIKLAVMIDRGFRELPIQADFVGKKIGTEAGQDVKVMFTETDGKNEVYVKG